VSARAELRYSSTPLRRARPLLFTLLSACHGAPDTLASASRGEGSSGAGDTQDATVAGTGGLVTTPTTTAGSADPDSGGGSSTGATASEPGTSGGLPPDTTGSTTHAADTSTGAAASDTTDAGGTADTGGTTDSSTGTDTGASESDGGGCPEGQLGCPCGQGCDPGLECEQGTCAAGPACGDGEIGPGEQCDDGPANGDTKACKSDCSKQQCGDGFVGPGEQCDDGPDNADTKACTSSCAKQVCGDGFIGPGEQCDDGANNADTKACKSSCTKQVCGDGFIGPGEQCDDGANNADTKACKSSCTTQVCGDGFVGPGEVCDDGNQVNGDGCEKTCVKSPIGKDACGFDQDGVWFQIDYEDAFTVSNPKYTYSATPGWGEPQWAPNGKNWPYTVDLFNNASVIEDQIGTVALLNGTNKAVRTYFGLTGLTYQHATVCVEGRSYSVGSSVTFRVENAANKCGAYGMMANDWSVHATGVDLGNCFIGGNNFQAVQVQPSGGSGALSLKRVRVTLHGASW